MVTIEEAEQQIQQRRQELAEAQRQQEAAEEQISKAESQTMSQKFRRQMSGIQGLRERQRIQANLSQARQDLLSRSQAIQQADSQLSEVQNQINEARGGQAEQSEAYQKAIAAYEKGDARIAYFGGKKATKIYRDLMENKQNAINSTLQNLESQGLDDAGLRDVERMLREDIGKTGSKQITTRINDYLNAKYNSQSLEIPTTETISNVDTQYLNLPQSPSLTGGQGVITKAEKETKLQKYVRETDRGDPGLFRTVAGFGAGVLLKGVDTVKSIPKIPSAIKETVKNPNLALLNLRQTVNEYPSYLTEKPIKATSSLFFDILAFKGTGKLAEVGTKSISKLGGLPKYETRFISKTGQMTDNMLFSDQIAITTEKSILGNREFISASRTKTVLNDNNFKSGTIGQVRERVYNPTVKGGYSYKEPKPFGSIEEGIAQDTSYNILLGKQKSLRATTLERPGYKIISASRNQVGDKQITKSFNVAGAVEQPDGYIYVAGKQVPYRINKGEIQTLKQGQGTNIGRIEKPIDSNNIFFDSGNQGTTRNIIDKNIISDQTTKKSINAAVASQSNTPEVIEALAARTKTPAGTVSEVLGSPVSSLKTEPKQSLFYGQGTYEKTHESEGVSQIYFQTPKESQKQYQANFNILGLKEESSQKFRTPLPNIQTNIPRVSQAQNIIFKFRAMLRNRQAQAQRTPLKTQSASISKTQKQLTPKMISWLGNKGSTSKKVYGQPKNDDFELFSFKGGEEFLFSKASNLRQALFKAKKFVDSNLRASFKIRRNGEAINLSNINLLGYRASKRDKTRLVQESKRRLSSGGERKEIQFFRKSKNKRNIWGI